MRKYTRGDFLALSAGAAGSVLAPGSLRRFEFGHDRQSAPHSPPAGFTPWLEIDSAALTHNARTVSQLVGGRPIIAVVKNNAYGLGLGVAGPLFDRMAEIRALAVVRPDEASALRRAGIRKPILLMGPASEEELVE